MRRPPSRFKRLLHHFEAALLYLVFVLARALPVDWASALGGWIARSIGPWLPVSRVGRDNLRRAFPEMPDAEIERVLRGVWDNLGRFMAEYPHLHRLWDFDPDNPGKKGRVEVVGAEHFMNLRDDGVPGLIFSAHFGNWELLPVGARRHDLPVAVLFRPPNNPFAARLVRKIRGAVMGELLRSGIQGIIGAVKVLEQGGHVGMLVDQHFRRGIAVNFFGRPVRTATAFARLARRFDCPVHGARVERLHGARFRVTVSPPLELPRTDDPRADVAAITQQITTMIEGWVRERPDQWLWLHRRWRE